MWIPPGQCFFSYYYRRWIDSVNATRSDLLFWYYSFTSMLRLYHMVQRLEPVTSCMCERERHGDIRPRGPSSRWRQRMQFMTLWTQLSVGQMHLHVGASVRCIRSCNVYRWCDVKTLQESGMAHCACRTHSWDVCEEMHMKIEISALLYAWKLGGKVHLVGNEDFMSAEWGCGHLTSNRGGTQTTVLWTTRDTNALSKTTI